MPVKCKTHKLDTTLHTTAIGNNHCQNFNQRPGTIKRHFCVLIKFSMTQARLSTSAANEQELH